jgi:hypothetical protein
MPQTKLEILKKTYKILKIVANKSKQIEVQFKFQV